MQVFSIEKTCGFRVIHAYSREHEEMARDSGVTVCIGAAFLHLLNIHDSNGVKQHWIERVERDFPLER